MKGGGDDGDSDSDCDSKFRDPSKWKVRLLIVLISDKKTNGNSRDMILSKGSVISGA